MNQINKKIYLSFKEGTPFSETFEQHVEIRRFILSETSFRLKDYPFLIEKFKLSNFEDEDSINFLRISLMNPYAKFLFEKFERSLEEKVLVAKNKYDLD